MKKIVSLILIIVALTIFATSCKKLVQELTWFKLDGAGAYSSQSDTSTIRVEGWVQIEQSEIAKLPSQLLIVDWQFLIFEGNQFVLELLKDGYYSLLGDVFLNTSSLEFEFLWVYLETTTPKTGDLFNGFNPDTMQLTLIVQDADGNTYQLEAQTNFQFTRD
ncbi:MAG: hypothetical protein GY940_34000 [bacterium]|nr:hypothetical protein [bacterium]